MKAGLKLAVLTLVLACLFSGCISGDSGEGSGTPVDTASATYGLMITGFSSQPRVDAGDSADVDFYAQNVGDAIARDLSVNLYQTGGFVPADAEKTPLVQNYTKLLPPDAGLGLTGDTYSTYWTLVAPTVESDQIKSLKARFTYDYTSLGTTNVYLVTKKDWDEKGEAAFTTYSTSSQAPVTIAIVPLNAMKVYTAVPDNGYILKKVSLDMVLRNTGTGFVEDDTLRDFTLKVNGIPFTRVEDSEHVTTFKEYYCKGLVGDTVSLFGANEERSLKCDMMLNYTGQSQSYIIEAETNYTYRMDTAPLSVLVEHVEGESVAGEGETFVYTTIYYCCKENEGTEQQWVEDITGRGPWPSGFCPTGYSPDHGSDCNRVKICEELCTVDENYDSWEFPVLFGNANSEADAGAGCKCSTP